MNGWVWHQKEYDGDRVPSTTNGWGHSLTESHKPLVVKHVLGFARADWGEGNWTAKDLK